MMKFLRVFKNHWKTTLWIVGFIGFVANSLIFYPGFMSNDSIYMLSQATGVIPLTDWVPIALSLLWRALIFLTGHVSSMLLFQLGMLWTALTLFAVYIYKVKGSIKLSLLPFVIAILPIIINTSGVIWKDNQMTFALALAVSLLLHLSLTKNKTGRILLVVTIGLLITYATLVRYNAIFALIPIIFFTIRQSGFIPRIRYQAITTVVATILIALLFPFLNFVSHARPSSPLSLVMLDDIVNISTTEEVTKSTISTQTKQDLERIMTCAADNKALINNFWTCPTDEERDRMQYPTNSDLRTYWLQTIAHHPIEYAMYRVQVYMTFLFPKEGTQYIFENGITHNDLGQHVKFERLGESVGIYVNNFGYKHFSFLYEPWFWLLASILLMVYARRLVIYKSLIFVLTLSSIIYILAYFPTGAAADYRFIYWPVLACLFVLVLLTLERRKKVAKIVKRK